MVSAMVAPPSSLTAAQPVSAITRAAFAEGLLRRLLVGAEGQVDDQSARAVPRRTAWPCRIIISSVTPSVEGSPCTTMPRLSPTSITSAS